MTEETKKPAPPTRAERTVRIVFRLSLIAAFAVISSCVLLLECLHDEERRIEMSQEQDSDSLRPLPIPIIILYFSIVASIATIIIWLVVLVLVRYFGKSAPLIGRPPAEVVSGSVPPTETPGPLPLEITQHVPDSKQKP